ncbi:MAG: DUF4331 family protein [Candidatus Eremiobacteraeota bacterium]|nr:DUF4331 family protein [Candidatus Eremiobacteraeota bacterium]
MSHHYSGPDLTFPHGDARLDFTDLYVFPKPGDASKSILIMDVHPSVGLNPQGPTTEEPFSTNALYELIIDSNGDLNADIAYSVRFSANGSEQTATVRRIEGSTYDRSSNDGKVIVEGAPVSMGREAKITSAGEYRFFAGWRSDPFFFDTLGALNNLTFTGQDFFTGKDVCSIALEVPNSDLGSDRVKIWARTVDGRSGSWVQADRGAHPQQVPFLAGDQKAAYLAADPSKDVEFVSVFAHSLEHTGGYVPDEATRVANIFLPDIMPYEPKAQQSYPKNGRALTEDVVAYFVPLISNGKVSGDGVSPHTDLLSDFPYLGPPHNS